MMKHQKSARIILTWVALFAIAMGFLESAVVIYIREIYYPEGFGFPLKVLDSHILLTEFFREVATLVMLIGIGVLAGRSRTERFGIFIYAFGWWDIFYYVFLKLILNWPESLLTWDVLFFIPTTWVGPVITPCINALTMILLGGAIIYFQGRHKHIGLKAREWILLIGGSAVLLAAYIEDYSKYMLKRYDIMELYFSLPNREMLDFATQYIPQDFNWPLYLAGQALVTIAVVFYWLRLRNRKSAMN